MSYSDISALCLEGVSQVLIPFLLFSSFEQVVLCISVDVSQDYNQVENVIKQVRGEVLSVSLPDSAQLSPGVDSSSL